MPGLVKIGKTSRSTEERLRELNVTSVPTPFVIAYEAFFDDCALAEQFVHAYLETRGHRVSLQREFFDAPLKLAVDAILAAQRQFGSGGNESLNDVAAVDLGHTSGFEPTLRDDPSADALAKANECRYGWRGEVQDERRAYALYQQAARLGSPEAFLALADMHQYGVGVTKSPEDAIRWLRKGADLGFRWCWAALSDLYLDGGTKHVDNARKCLRRFFKNADISVLDDGEERQFFFRLKQYLQLRDPAYSDFAEDAAVIEHAASQLLKRIAANKDIRERDARKAAVQQLLCSLGARR